MLSEEDIKKAETLGPSRFTFNGNIIAEIGEESISNPNIAIAELVKNSYDADSKKTTIRFDHIERHNSKIIISDDGTGMDSAQIKDRWMDIGSPHKKDIDLTPEHKRIPVGAKGIGRFASHCLGKSMKLITASAKEKFGYKLTFDWEKYSPRVKATDIDNEFQRFGKKLSTRGTTLVIEKLKQQWNDNDKLKDLLRDIYLLTSPIEPPKNFKIHENLSSQITDLPKLEKSFLEKAGYHLKAELKKKKEITVKFFKNEKKIKEYESPLDKELSCGDVVFDLYFYYKKASTWKENLEKDLEKGEIDKISTMLGEYGGIKVYRDGFRVKPYGDTEADWLGLDKWSRDQTRVPGNTQVIGIVSIGRDTNSKIVDTTTREGVVNNKEYFDLVQFVTTCIKEFVECRDGVEPTKAKAKKPKKIKVVAPKVQGAPAQAIEIPDFINAKGAYPTNHYDQLVHEANECERNNYPNAAFWMSRKIVENLIYHILQKKFPTETALWFDTTKRRNESLSKLIENLSSKKDDFKPQVKQHIEQFKQDVGKFKKDVDAAVHKNQVYLGDKNELKQYKIPKLVQLLLEIYGSL